MNEPFTVGGEKLMFPGDKSLGASAGNLYNCRCRVKSMIKGHERDRITYDEWVKDKEKQEENLVMSQKMFYTNNSKKEDTTSGNAEIDKVRNKIRNGEISTRISQQKQSRHIKGTKQYNEYLEKLSAKGDKPSYIREDLNIKKLFTILHDKYGTGEIDILNDNSIQEFFDVDEAIGYYYHKKTKQYKKTNRVQVKYALGDRNIHIIPVKPRSN